MKTGGECGQRSQLPRNESKLKANVKEQAKIIRKLRSIDDCILALHSQGQDKEGNSLKEAPLTRSLSHGDHFLEAMDTYYPKREDKVVMSSSAHASAMRSEMDIINEFTANMEVHRKLLLRKEEQINLHGAIVDSAVVLEEQEQEEVIHHFEDAKDHNKILYNNTFKQNCNH